MTSFLALLLFIFISAASPTANSSCEQKVADSYLDAAVDMITKAKNNLSARCENNASRKFLDCSELLEAGYIKSGVYTIWPVNRLMQGKALQVYCDMETDGGGWTLIQRRGNFGRAVDYFYKNWKSYKEGFGNIEKDFWLGNDNIYVLTNQNLFSARFDLRDVENISRYAEYDKFWTDDENHKYTLHISDYTGNAGDSMIDIHNNHKFSAKDQDNDKKDLNCAEKYKGGWWYNSCFNSNLNGLYLNSKNTTSNGIIWKTWTNYNESLKSTEIKIRPKMFKLTRVSLNNTPM